MEKYIAHILKEENKVQSLDEHSKNVAQLANEFASHFNMGEEGYLCGLLHDLGKGSKEFQKYISDTDNHNKIDHSTAGAFELLKLKHVVSSMCVASHHSGLLDFGNPNLSTESDGTFSGRIKKASNKSIPDYSMYFSTISIPPCNRVDKSDYIDNYFRSKMLFSCLVDADYLDTEHFFNGNNREYDYSSITQLLYLLNEYVKRFDNPTTELNKIRCDIRNQCIIASNYNYNFFSLTVPTGGGKTIASLSFALNYAKKHNKRRIIYVIPYITIIDQTVQLYTDILGSHNVLPHYSEYDYNSEDDDSKKLAVENWDAPVVITTNVQFFDSIYSNKSSLSRKLHNISDSVVIFDEYQLIPVDYTMPCIEAIKQFIINFNCCVLLSTATQPGTKLYGNFDCHEIIPNVPKLFNDLRRVSYNYKGEISKKSLANELRTQDQVLCIVNNKSTAYELYSMLEDDNSFYLTTLLTPYDRSKIINSIKDKLKTNQSCKVISTSLIEAGIDLDFSCVYREENGLDSIVQAAGRCNREGKRNPKNSIVNIFSLNDSPITSQIKNRDAMRESISLGASFDDPNSASIYFNQLYDLKGIDALDKKQILKMILGKTEFGILPFKSIGEKFSLIDQNTTTIYIPCCNQAQNLIDQLKFGIRNKSLFRKLGKYSVNIYTTKLFDYLKYAYVVKYDDVYILNDTSLYNDKTGLSFPPEISGDAYFI